MNAAGSMLLTVAVGDVVDPEGYGNEQPERLATAEGDPDGHPFRKGVERHDPDHEQRLAGVERAHAREDGRVLFSLDQAAGDDDKEETRQDPEGRTPQAVRKTL